MHDPSPADGKRSPRAQIFSFVKRIAPNGWTAAVMAIALLFSIPVWVVLGNIFAPTGEIWQQLASTVLPRYIRNSIWLMLGVGSGAAAIGVATAWLVSLCRFPGSQVFEWALLLPIAAPAYVLAYTYTDVFDVSGPVQSAIRAWTGWGPRDYWFPPIRSLGGAIAMLVLVLYPYVYLPTRIAFLKRSRSLLEASLSLGCGPWRTFWTVALPLARPAIAGGVALVLMETLNDFGTVQFFGVDTFTTGIFRTWFGLGEPVAAAQLAALLLMFIFGIFMLERRSRGRMRYEQQSAGRLLPPSHDLSGWRAAAAFLTCAIPVGLGFLLPGGVLLNWSVRQARLGLGRGFWGYVANTAMVASLTSLLAVAIALLIAYGLRLQRNSVMRFAARFATMGYAVPGSVIAVGVLIPMAGLDNAIDAWMRNTFNFSTGLLLSGTIAGLVFAYLVRFLSVSFNTIESSLVRIQPSLDDAARSLGYSPIATLTQVHAPLIASGLFSAAMLVFVDVVKELPATLVLRPFNFDTMAVRVFRLASDERLAQSAPGALAIVVVGMIPAIFLILTVLRSRSPTRKH
ncbi:iron ABC transporter permease [Synechococcus sp. PCC 7336]|uniref:ABC transporter permease n=1 Tax=Synechococcus sp. PCC 7336 TaxID=195250 RepID=UPI00034691C5|nr:iron ABC transporter permease [Synechococcus sp. PCC 7336]